MAASYGATAKAFHWLTVLGIVVVVPLGIAMLNVGPGPTQNSLFDLHRSVGFVIFVLAAGRLLWRLFHPPPPLPADLPGWQRGAALATHWMLYALLFAVPVLGWLGSSYFGAAVSVFGLFTLPVPVAQDRAMAETVLAFHVWGVIALGALVALHAGAALHHHFVRRDDVLTRMLPGHRSAPERSTRHPAA
ncbi:MAG: cytochrome b [Caenispirillum bisanense]|nr:cytochrome b [Caenispirillum bisanense]MCA1971970.1 cytochrome b [Caenispirillum sp.]